MMTLLYGLGRPALAAGLFCGAALLAGCGSDPVTTTSERTVTTTTAPADPAVPPPPPNSTTTTTTHTQQTQ